MTFHMNFKNKMHMHQYSKVLEEEGAFFEKFFFSAILSNCPI